MPERCSSVGPSKVPFGRSRGRQIILRPARRRGKPLDAMPPGSKRRRESRMEPKRKRIEKVPDRRRLTSAPWSAALGIVAGAGGQSPLLVFGGPETRPRLFGVLLRSRPLDVRPARALRPGRPNRTGRNALDVRPGCVIDVAGSGQSILRSAPIRSSPAAGRLAADGPVADTAGPPKQNRPGRCLFSLPRRSERLYAQSFTSQPANPPP
jgi:hypothetical protein